MPRDLPPVHGHRTYATGTSAARQPPRRPLNQEVACRYCGEIESLSPRKLGQHVAAWCPDAPDLDLEDAIEHARGWFQDAREESSAEPSAEPVRPAEHDVDDVDDQDDVPDQLETTWWCPQTLCGYGTRSRAKALEHLDLHDHADRRDPLEVRGNMLVEISTP